MLDQDRALMFTRHPGFHCSPGRHHRAAGPGGRRFRTRPVPTFSRPMVGAVIAVVGLASLAACRPLQPYPVAPVPGPAGAALTVDSNVVVGGQAVTVGATGCSGDFQYTELRLVVGAGAGAFSLAVTSGGPDGGEIEVPHWAPPGPASISGSCLEPDFSGASDGADVLRFDFPTLAVSIQTSPLPQVAPTLSVPAQVTGGVATIGGAGCGGRVLVSVAAGADQVASSARFRYGRRLVTAAPDGSWSAQVPLTYSAGSLTDPVPAGPMTAFAVCEGRWYLPATFSVPASSPAPAVHLTGQPGTIGLTQCPAYNTLGVIALVDRAVGGPSVLTRNQPGPGYGEQFVTLDLPADAIAVTWFASCVGRYRPAFGYLPAHRTIP